MALAFWTDLPEGSILALGLGAMGLILAKRLPASLLWGILAGLALSVVWGEKLAGLDKALAFLFVVFFLGPNKPEKMLQKVFAVILGLLAAVGHNYGLISALILWGMSDILLSRDSRNSFRLTQPPPEPLLANNLPQPSAHDLLAVRLCRRESGVVAVWAELPPPQTCRLGRSALACAQGCLGFGDCQRACPAQAITLDHNRAPQIDPLKCLGCGLCLKACPQDLYALVPRNYKVIIPCRGQEKMKTISDLCQKGCLGCGRCVKACPAKAFLRPEFGPPRLNQPSCLYWPDCQMACQNACPRGIPEPRL
jgi:electron transport complex protein RnfB